MSSEIAAVEDYLNATFLPDGLPNAVRDAVWKKAWDDGHASGIHEVEMHYEELADIVKAAYEAGHRDGFNEGWDDGYGEGDSEGWQNGYELGLERGREEAVDG